MVRPDSGGKKPAQHDAIWVSGTVAASKRGDYSPIVYLVETDKLDGDGFAIAHWVGMRNVRPVDRKNPAQVMEWLDG